MRHKQGKGIVDSIKPARILIDDRTILIQWTGMPMAYSFDSAPKDDPLIRSTFHRFLVAFAAPARWPTWAIYLSAATLAAAVAVVWAAMGSGFNNALLLFLITASCFVADRNLLVTLPGRRVSFGPWQSQLFALALPRAAAALIFGLLLPWLGWTVAFYANIAVQFIGYIALYRGAIVEPGRLTLTEQPILLDRLAPGSRGLRILHISDLHIECLSVRETQLLEMMHSAAADVILITGDYVNISFNVDPLTHAQVRELLGKLDAPLGVYAVPGSPAVDLPDVVPPLFEGTPVRLLRNETVVITAPGGERFTIMGLDCRHDIVADTMTMDRVRATANEEGPRILLYHSPDLMPQAIDREIDLYLCGHTHGGQVRLPIIGPILTSSKLGRRYVMGHYAAGRTHLYVSRGVGFEGLGAPRVRLFCPPEIALITLSGGEVRQ